MSDKLYSTPKGFEILKEKLSNLKEQQKETLKDIKKAQEDNSELSENNEYLEAKDRLSYIDKEIAKYQERISKTTIIEKPKNPEKVVFGSTVKMIDVDTEEELTMTIVGEEESDIKNGFISYLSPLSRSIIGKMVGDETSFDLPNGKDRMIEVIDIK